MLTTLATEIMSTPVVTITVEKPVSAAARIMLDNHGGSLVVVDENGFFVGLISDSKYWQEESALPYLRQSVLRLLGSQLGDPENFEEVIENTRNI